MTLRINDEIELLNKTLEANPDFIKGRVEDFDEWVEQELSNHELKIKQGKQQELMEKHMKLRNILKMKVPNFKSSINTLENLKVGKEKEYRDYKDYKEYKASSISNEFTLKNISSIKPFLCQASAYINLNKYILEKDDCYCSIKDYLLKINKVLYANLEKKKRKSIMFFMNFIV